MMVALDYCENLAPCIISIMLPMSNSKTSQHSLDSYSIVCDSTQLNNHSENGQATHSIIQGLIMTLVTYAHQAH